MMIKLLPQLVEENGTWTHFSREFKVFYTEGGQKCEATVQAKWWRDDGTNLYWYNEEHTTFVDGDPRHFETRVAIRRRIYDALEEENISQWPG